MSFAINLAWMPLFIESIRKYQKYGQPIRLDGPESHLLNKKNTPTMGGLFIISSVLVFSLIFCDLRAIYIPLLCLIFYGILGAYDDYIKISKNHANGITARTKFLIQFLLATGFTLLLYWQNPLITNIYFPFYGQVDLGYWFFPLAILVIISSSNAFNLTDGLDGLSISQFIISILFFLVILLGLTNYHWMENYFYKIDLIKLCAILISSSLVFWWFNSFPAKIFMGDIGSLALGALLGIISLMLAAPILLFFSALVMVAETISVILQVLYFKQTKGKRLFLMAPIHHHFEKQNIHENKIIIAMMIIAIIINVVTTQLI